MDTIPALASTMPTFSSARRKQKCHIRCNIIFTEIIFHPESSRLLTYYILGFAAYFLYMIFFPIPVLNDDSDKSSKTKFLCELYYDVKFLLPNKFNLKLV